MHAAGGLVGREAESAQLNRIVTQDTERAVVVSGEAGVGKTALIGQLCANAVTDGWRVVQILGVEAEAPFALGGLNQLAVSLQQFVPGLDARDRAVLATVFDGDSDAALTALPLVISLLNLLTLAAQAQPILLVIDDVQWLDSVSAEVLGAVGRRLTDPRVRIVAGRRTPYESAFSHTGWSDLHLGPLDAESSAQLLASAGLPS